MTRVEMTNFETFIIILQAIGGLICGMIAGVCVIVSVYIVIKKLDIKKRKCN